MLGQIPVAVAKPVVTGVRIGATPAKTRFVIELSERVKFRAFTLATPHRVVIDLPAVDWQIADNSRHKGGLITALRTGRLADGATRVVLDVAKPARVAKSFGLAPAKGSNRHRLVVDIKAMAAPDAPAAGARAPVAPDRLATYGVPGTVPPVARDAAPGAVRAPVAKPLRPRAARKLIAIDAGHGGADPGATGISGVREKDLMLIQARELKRRLEATGRFKVILTRYRDEFIRLRRRIAIARRAGAELFISLHADSIANPKIRGGSIYTLSERASDREAAALAARENKADLIAGVDLEGRNREVTNILINLAQRNSKNESAKFAKILTGELSKTMKMLRRTHRFAGFAVLKAPDIPSVLVELGYLSNPVDERNLRRKRHRTKIAKAIVRAVDDYFSRQQAFNRP